MKTRMLVALLLGVSAILVAGCGGGAQATPAPSGEAIGAPAATSAAEQPADEPTQPGEAPPPSSSGFDVAAVDLCAVLPRAELAGLAGGTPYEGAETSGTSCIYTIDPGDGTAELYSMSVSPPDLIQPMVEYVRQYEEAEWLEGIGGAAYLQPADFGEGFDLVVLVEGAFGLSLGGPRAEVLQAAARLIVERLGG